MASGFDPILVICLACGLWTAEAKCAESSDDCCVTCPSGWTQFDGRCYLFHYGEKDWIDAEKLCTSIGGNLASFQSAELYAFLREMIFRSTNQHKPAWVGGHDAVKNGAWLWSDGTKFDFKLWASGEPNNVEGKNCMELNFEGKDRVNDLRCIHKRSFICARDP